MSRTILRGILLTVAPIAAFALALASAAMYFGASDEHMQQDRARTQLRMLAGVIEQYRRDTGHLPLALGELTSPNPFPDGLGPYAKASSLIDPWGSPLYYGTFGTGDFIVFTLGSDHKIGGNGSSADFQVSSLASGH